MYADDTSISYTSKNIGELNTVMNGDLDCLNKWLQGNKLLLNVVKTQAMVIGSQPNLKKIANNFFFHYRHYIIRYMVDYSYRKRKKRLNVKQRLQN